MGLLEELAVRCEAATGADYDLTMEIVRLDYDTRGGIGLGVDFDPDLWMMRRELDPVTSMDAAKMLVPKHALWSTGDDVEGPFARICIPVGIGYFGGEQPAVFAATPALALTAASLRARHVMTKGSDA